MINANMRVYNFFSFGASNAYGQPVLSKEPTGTIKMSISNTGTAIQDNALYKNATYIGLTTAEVNDTYVIEYGKEKLKVLYVNPVGRLKQVFMATYG